MIHGTASGSEELTWMEAKAASHLYSVRTFGTVQGFLASVEFVVVPHIAVEVHQDPSAEFDGMF